MNKDKIWKMENGGWRNRGMEPDRFIVGYIYALT